MYRSYCVCGQVQTFLKAKSKSHYHNCKKYLKAASGTSLPCLSLFCKEVEGREWEATIGRALDVSETGIS